MDTPKSLSGDPIEYKWERIEMMSYSFLFYKQSVQDSRKI